MTASSRPLHKGGRPEAPSFRWGRVHGRTAYLELVGYGNLTFDGVGTRNMVMHDPSSGETWDCAPR